MAYGKSNGHVLDDVACAGLLIRNWLHSHATSRNDEIAWKYRNTANIIEKKLQFITLLTAIENSKNDKGYIIKQHVDIMTKCCFRRVKQRRIAVNSVINCSF